MRVTQGTFPHLVLVRDAEERRARSALRSARPAEGSAP